MSGETSNMGSSNSLEISGNGRLHNLLLYSATTTFGLTILLAMIQVIGRFFSFSIPGPSTDTSSRLLLIVTTFLGAAVAARNDEHIRMTVFVDRLKSENAKNIFRVIAGFISIVSLLVFFYSAMIAAVSNWGVPIAGLDNLHVGWAYVIIAFSFGSYILFELQKIIKLSDTLNKISYNTSRTGQGGDD